MVSRIKENIPNRFVSIEHLGMVQAGKEIMSGDKVDQWLAPMKTIRLLRITVIPILRLIWMLQGMESLLYSNVACSIK